MFESTKGLSRKDEAWLPLGQCPKRSCLDKTRLIYS